SNNCSTAIASQAFLSSRSLPPTSRATRFGPTLLPWPTPLPASCCLSASTPVPLPLGWVSQSSSSNWSFTFRSESSSAPVSPRGSTTYSIPSCSAAPSFSWPALCRTRSKRLEACGKHSDAIEQFFWKGAFREFRGVPRLGRYFAGLPDLLIQSPEDPPLQYRSKVRLHIRKQESHSGRPHINYFGSCFKKCA